jgi:hypothetical protein
VAQVLLSDLDVDLLPLATVRSARLGLQTTAEVRSEWQTKLPELLARLRLHGEAHSAQRRGAIHGVFSADEASPLNAGLMLLLPSERLFDDGLSVLASPFAVDRGWNLSGPPAEVLRAPLRFVDGRVVRHVNLRALREWSFVNADSDQGFFAYMLLGRHGVGRYASLAHRPPAALVHHHFRKPWGALRFLQGGPAAGTAPAGSAVSISAVADPRSTALRVREWPKGWRGAPLSAVCAVLRQLHAIDALQDGRPPAAHASPCLREMARELRSVADELRGHGSETPWPLCVADCLAAPDNPGHVLWLVNSVF